MRAVRQTLPVGPSLGRGPGSWCALDGAHLDAPLMSPRIDRRGGVGFDEECRRLAGLLRDGREVQFRYESLTAFTVTITPEEAVDGGLPSWVGPQRQGLARVALRIGLEGATSMYYHPLGKGGSWAYIGEKHRLGETDARVIDYLLAAIGEALRELETAEAATPEGGDTRG